MRRPRRQRIATLLLGLACAVAALVPVPGAEPPGAAGHWEGAITLPNASLDIKLDLEQAGDAWKGTIDIPAQGLRGFALGALVVAEGNVSFTMPNIPGEPTFRGRLAGDGTSIAGDFSQAGQTFPFKVARAEKVEDKAATPSKGIPGQGFAGFWQGSLKVSAVELRLVLELAQTGDGLTGTIDSIDQNAQDIPISKASAEQKKLHLELASIGGTFDGELSADGSEIVGQWQQGGESLPLVFKRVAKAPDLGRAQDPHKPYPYIEEQVKLPNARAGIELAGTLTIPRSGGPHPAAVLLTGSGPQDRDETIFGHRPFLVVSDHLTRRGIAVLRYDDRGVGQSGGKYRTATNADFVSDALAAVAYLRTRSEIDPRRIGLIGHSEGGLTAPRAAVQSDGIAWLVLMAGVGVPLEQLLLRQASDLQRVAGADAESIARHGLLQREMFRVVREQGATPQARRTLIDLLRAWVAESSQEQPQPVGIDESVLEGQIDLLVSPWFAELLDYDPRATLGRVRCPVLAINGENDLQVSADENLAAIEHALEQGGNTNVTVLEFPGLNHLFQSSKTGVISEYGTIEETIAPVVLETIADWVRVQSGLAGDGRKT